MAVPGQQPRVVVSPSPDQSPPVDLERAKPAPSTDLGWAIAPISPSADPRSADRAESAARPPTSAFRVTSAAQTDAPEILITEPPLPSAPGSGPRDDPAPPPPTPVAPPEITGDAALARISYPWQSALPGWSIEFRPAQGSLRGLTLSGERRIEIYVHTTDVNAVARVIAHELGHAADLTFNSTRSRRTWEAARGIGDEVPWWPSASAADFSTGSGDFAECFATWQVGTNSRSAFGACSASDLDLLISLV